jgi:hypothetical protein
MSPVEGLFNKELRFGLDDLPTALLSFHVSQVVVFGLEQLKRVADAPLKGLWPL